MKDGTMHKRFWTYAQWVVLVTLAGCVVGCAWPSVAAAARKVTRAAIVRGQNPYGLSSLWAQGDWIARGTLVLLALMSVASWYVLVTKLIDQSRLQRQARQARKHFWDAGSLEEGAGRLAKDSAFRALAEAGLNAARNHGGLTGKIDLHGWIGLSVERAVAAILADLQGGLAVLATVGSTAPFIGLFGTVWGIYHALTAIGVAGQATIDKVAGPVGEALIMTALGLATAVPAVLAYNWLVRRNKVIADAVRSFAAEFHAVLLGTEQGGAS